MTVPTPIDVGPWQIQATSLFDDASVVHTGRLLPDRPRERAVYELYSLRMTMSEDGTGDLASMGFTDGPLILNTTISNTDGALMSIRPNMFATAVTPTIYWHMGRSNQLGQGIGASDIYLPPGFYWGSGLHGVFQNGAGAGIEFMWTVVYRVAIFSRKDFPNILRAVAPLTTAKARIVST